MIIVGLSLKGLSETGKNQEGTFKGHPHSNMAFDENQEKMDAVMQLIQKALRINGLGCRSKDKTAEMPTVFINYYGHTSKLEISCFTAGWFSGCREDLKSEIYTDKPIERFRSECWVANRMLDHILAGMPNE